MFHQQSVYTYIIHVIGCHLTRCRACASGVSKSPYSGGRAVLTTGRCACTGRNIDCESKKRNRRKTFGEVFLVAVGVGRRVTHSEVAAPRVVFQTNRGVRAKNDWEFRTEDVATPNWTGERVTPTEEPSDTV